MAGLDWGPRARGGDGSAGARDWLSEVGMGSRGSPSSSWSPLPGSEAAVPAGPVYNSPKVTVGPGLASLNSHPGANIRAPLPAQGCAPLAMRWAIYSADKIRALP